MNFKLKSPHSNNESLIIFYANLKNRQRFVYSTGEKISPKLWDPLIQYPIRTKVRTENDYFFRVGGINRHRYPDFFGFSNLYTLITDYQWYIIIKTNSF